MNEMEIPMDPNDLLDEYKQLQDLHWSNLKATFDNIEALLDLIASESEPTKAEILSIAQKQLAETKVKWIDEEDQSNG